MELGRIAGLGIARRLGALDETRAAEAAAPARGRLKGLAATRPFLDALYRPRPEVFSPSPETMVCRCECQSAAVIRAAAGGGADPNQVKIVTRAGMGPCQGRPATCHSPASISLTGWPNEGCRFRWSPGTPRR